jgi:hypothetical protein
MAFLKFLEKSKEIPVCSFGKLPIYQDYINIVPDAAGNAWKTWLLNSFGHDGIDIPPGVWPFCFRPAGMSEFLVGVIEPSSDGIRQFPFSLYVVWQDKKGLRDWAGLHSLWDRLVSLRGELLSHQTVEEFYQVLGGKLLVMDKGESMSPGIDSVLESCLGRPNGQAIFLVTPLAHQPPALLSAEPAENGIMKAQWQQLAGM